MQYLTLFILALTASAAPASKDESKPKGTPGKVNPERIKLMEKAGSYDKCVADCVKFRTDVSAQRLKNKAKSEKKCQSGCQGMYSGGGSGGSKEEGKEGKPKKSKKSKKPKEE